MRSNDRSAGPARAAGGHDRRWWEKFGEAVGLGGGNRRKAKQGRVMSR